MENYELGLVLSGGSVRGSAHVGLLQRLKDLGHSPDVIAGSSAGAMIGAFHAAGRTAEEILGFFRKTPLFQYTSINPLTSGIFDTKKYASVFKGFIPETFEELEIPLIICATNVETGEAVYFDSGDLYQPLLASCAIPLVFAPIEINGMLHIDGGVMDNFPLEQIERKTNFIIGSYLGNPGTASKKQVNSKLKITNRSNQLLMYSAIKHKFQRTDFTLEYPLQKYGYFDQKKMDEMYEIGYAYAKENISSQDLAPVRTKLIQ